MEVQPLEAREKEASRRQEERQEQEHERLRTERGEREEKQSLESELREKEGLKAEARHREDHRLSLPVSDLLWKTQESGSDTCLSMKEGDQPRILCGGMSIARV